MVESVASSLWQMHYLFYENHPFVMIFFLSLVSMSAVALLAQTYTSLPLKHQLVIPPLLSTPFTLTYLCSARSASTRQQIVTPGSLARHLRAYPYDHILFHPDRICSTCDLIKPPRSKHCRLCKVCVARSDHHCAWVNNCVGKANTRWFLLLLLSMTVLCLYGAFIAWISVAPIVHTQLDLIRSRRRQFRLAAIQIGKGHLAGDAEEKWLDTFVTALSIAVQKGGWNVAGVGMLAGLTWPMPLGLLVYHIYLLWAGMTTNESSKWDDLREDMRDGLVYVGSRKGKSGWVGVNGAEGGRGRSTERFGKGQGRARSRDGDCGEEWPARSRYMVVYTEDGQLPADLSSRYADSVDEASWKRCWRLADVDNVYDLGLWDNIVDIAKG